MDSYHIELVENYIERHVSSAARELERQDARSAASLLTSLSPGSARRVLVQMLPFYAARVLQSMPPESSALILQDCYANQIASMLRQCPEVGRERLLQGLSGRVAGRSRRLLKYSGDTVGAWMIVDILVLPADIDVSGALERVAGDTYICDANNLPVVGQERKLIGSVALAELLRATPNTSVGTLTRSLDVSGLSANLSLSGAERHPGWHYSDSLLVVNQQEEVEGALRFSTLRRALGILQEPDPGTTSIMSDYLQTYQLTLSSLFNLVSGGLHKPVDFKFDERGETT